MPGLKEIANCMWVGAKGGGLPLPIPPPSPFSVVRHLFGYTAQGYTGPLSVKQQISLVQGRHVHLNMIRVGVESFTTANDQAIDQALEITRAIYATVGVGVGRVLRFSIPEVDANESFVFQSIMILDGMAAFLTNSWTVHNNGMDIFLVLQFDPIIGGGTIGRSEVGGPCDKDDTCVMTGSIVSLEMGAATTGLVLAHEAGHYLGLSHINNLTAQSVDLDQNGVIDPTIPASVIANLMFPVATSASTTLTMGQGGLMMMHCFSRPGC
jgi:hypothetical protein